MNKWLTLGAFGALAFAVILPLKADVKPTSSGTSAQLARACSYAPGGWASVDCSAGVAYSAQLTANARYVIQCTGNALIAFGNAASGADADTSDGYIPAGAWADHYTSTDARYYSCLELAGSNSICRHIECR